MKATWTRNNDPDAEFNSHVADYKGHKLEVFSDREENNWYYTVDDGEMRNADSKREAQIEAEADCA